jgi:hypothetical protein
MLQRVVLRGLDLVFCFREDAEMNQGVTFECRVGDDTCECADLVELDVM